MCARGGPSNVLATLRQMRNEVDPRPTNDLRQMSFQVAKNEKSLVKTHTAPLLTPTQNPPDPLPSMGSRWAKVFKLQLKLNFAQLSKMLFFLGKTHICPLLTTFGASSKYCQNWAKVHFP